MAEVTVNKVRCDWDGCTESIELEPGDTVADHWLTFTVTDLNTKAGKAFAYDPFHGRMWRDSGFKILGDPDKGLIGTTP